MTEVYLIGGTVWKVKTGIDRLNEIIQDSFLDSDSFIPLLLEDGTKGYVRKRYIEGFCECVEDNV